MRLELQRCLFVGVRIDSKLRDALATCPARDRSYFDGSSERSLHIFHAEDDSYIGKVIDAGPTASALEDMTRHILSLLARLGGRRTSDDVCIFACDSAAEPPPSEPKPNGVEHF